MKLKPIHILLIAAILVMACDWSVNVTIGSQDSAQESTSGQPAPKQPAPKQYINKDELRKQCTTVTNALDWLGGEQANAIGETLVKNETFDFYTGDLIAVDWLSQGPPSWVKSVCTSGGWGIWEVTRNTKRSWPLDGGYVYRAE